MPNWYTIANQADIPAGKYKEIDIEDHEILLVNHQGTFYAIENLCTHDGGDLSEGELEGDEIICPRHGARFCIKTGEATCPPAYEDINSYPIRIVDSEIQIALDD